jgi:hypothetical protein
MGWVLWASIECIDRMLVLWAQQADVAVSPLGQNLSPLLQGCREGGGMRWLEMMTRPVCLRSPRLLPGVEAYFVLVGTSERLPMRTTGDVWSETICKLSVESVRHVDRVFSYRVYIDSNRRDSRIWVSLVCGSRHVDSLIELNELVLSVCLELKFESKDSLVVWVWHYYRAFLWSLAY